jgi:hypothetical protein
VGAVSRGKRIPSSLLHLWVFAPFWNAKTTIYGLLAFVRQPDYFKPVPYPQF